MSYPYTTEKYQIWYTQKESAMRTPTGGAGKDTFDPDQVLYCFPVVPEKVLSFVKRNSVYMHTANIGPDYGYIGVHGHSEGMLVISGPLHDFGLLYFACKGCTTAGDGTPYTHTYATTTARTSPPPTFGMMIKVYNATTANDLAFYYFGCVISAWSVKASVDNPDWQGSFTIKYAYCLATTDAITATETVRDTNIPYSFETTAITYTKNTVAYTVLKRGFSIEYDDGTILYKGDNDAYPNLALHGERKISVTLDLVPEDYTALADHYYNPLTPTAASVVDLSIVATKDANHSLSFAFARLWSPEMEDPTYAWDNYRLVMSPKFILKPVAYEAGALLTIVASDLKANTQYEGA